MGGCFGVASNRRRNGVGTALMHAFEGAVHKAGALHIHYGPYIPSYITPGVDVHAYADGVAFLNAIGADEGMRPLSMKASLTNNRAESNADDRGHQLKVTLV